MNKVNQQHEIANEINYYPGIVVCMRAHPFSSRLSTENLRMFDDGLSPLLVISEWQKELRDAYDEHTGAEQSKKGKFNYKCWWYSYKTNGFNEIWLKGKDIKPLVGIEEKEPMINDEAPEPSSISNFNLGDIVTLKTSRKELSRVGIKSWNVTSQGTIKPNAQNLTSYVCPPMEIIGFPHVKEDEANFDQKTGKRKRYKIKKLVKCRYFNRSQNKFSEVILPVEILEPIKVPDDETLIILSEAIQSNILLLAKRGLQNARVILPKSVQFIFGFYYILFENYLTKQLENLPISDVEFSTFTQPEENRLPRFEIGKDITLIKKNNQKELEKLFNKNGKYKYLRLRYTKYSTTGTQRVLTDFEFITIPIILKSSDKEPTRLSFVKGFCTNKKAVRFFYLGHIGDLELIESDFMLI